KHSSYRRDERDELVMVPLRVLEEGDIPGAKLQKPVEQCTVAVLRGWLSCRGAKVTGKREDLVKRVNDYIKNGLDKKVVDPDGGVNLAKKRLEFGFAEELHPEVNENFPSTVPLGLSDVIPWVTFLFISEDMACWPIGRRKHTVSVCKLEVEGRSEIQF
ncbi:Hypothetical predicted protein, partial [Paramuricea clavata]